MGITELADLVRAGLDKDQRDAEKHACALDCLRAVAQDWHQVRNMRGLGSTMNALRAAGLGDLGQDIPGHPGRSGHGIHYVGMRGTAMDPATVLRDVAAKRLLLDQALAWEHYEVDDPWYSCPASAHHATAVGAAGPCTCGRDERVLAVLQALAAPYKETDRG